MSDADDNLFQSVLERHPEHVKAIGMISIEVANLEVALGELLAALLHVIPEIGHTIYLTPQSNMARISMIANVAADSFVKDSKAAKTFAELFERVRTIMGKRHEIMHNAWGIDMDDQNVIVRRSLPFKQSNPAKPVHLNELSTLLKQIREVHLEVRTHTKIIFREWPPYTWQGKYPEQFRDGSTSPGAPHSNS
jgi:hypothetical protein